MPSKFRSYIIPIVLLLFIIGFSMIPIKNEANNYHSPAELAYFRIAHQAIPLDSNLIFPTATHCSGCHGHDLQGFAMVDSKGNDVNTHDDWQTSMMANSAKDPFWRAKVSHEVHINPAHKNEIENTCTACHAPQGHYTSLIRGHEFYTMDSLRIDTTGLDGVSCMACHMMKDSLLGDLHSGGLIYDTTRVSYGPYEIPFAQPMQSFVGFEPVYSEHINDAGMCAGCHTLVTETLDLNGNKTGATFVEQATYHEWLNSSYSNPKAGTTCQDCHMPRIDDTIVISANYLFLDGRSPYGLHDLVGGNTFMLKLMKEHKESLGINATDEMFDETIRKTERMLQEQTLDLLVRHDSITLDTAYFTLDIRNKAGHKFPSGYPSRRAVVEFLVTSEKGDTLFHSGAFDDTYEAIGHNESYEPHFDVIRNSDEVQIYEQVIGNVADEFSTVLTRGASSLKDNRIPPLGFTTTHEVYDTTTITGKALMDENFNKFNGIEGSGKDLVRYHFPIDGYVGNVNVSAKVWYQSLPPRWLAPMLAETTPEIDTFRIMYDNADQSPVLMVEDTLQNVFVETMVSSQNIATTDARIYPNPSSNGLFFIELGENEKLRTVEVYTINGQKISAAESLQFSIMKEGFYIVKIETDKGWKVEKVLVLL